MEEENKVSAHLWCISFLTVSLIRHFSFLVSTGRKGRSDRHVEEGRQGRQEGKRWWRRRFGGRGRQSLRQQKHTQPFMFAPPPPFLQKIFHYFFQSPIATFPSQHFYHPGPLRKVFNVHVTRSNSSSSPSGQEASRLPLSLMHHPTKYAKQPKLPFPLLWWIAIFPGKRRHPSAFDVALFVL